MNRYHRKALLAMFIAVCPPLWASGAAGQSLGMLSSGKAETGILATGGGRFVFGQISESAKDQYMLDTRTGRLWRIGHSGKIGVFLKPIPYRSESGECNVLPGEAGTSKAPAKGR
ncbi:MAG: hypothetical protein DRH20_16650, partial [Deltaproteobacteria bacterium]